MSSPFEVSPIPLPNHPDGSAPARPFRTKEDFVADYLREGILSGRLPRGTRLKQTEVAEEIQFSITPVREAFRILETEGYLTSETHRGVVVAPFNASDTHEINELRVVLETRLALLAMKQMTATNYTELGQLEREFEDADARQDREAVRAINYRFHKHLYTLAGQPQTLHFVLVLWARYPFDLINRIDGRPGRAATEHRELLDTLRKGDGKAVARSIRSHIDHGWRELQSSLATPQATGTGPATAAPGDRRRKPAAQPVAARRDAVKAAR
jgi:DNA-binding GntR family transcriptional regulator